MDQRDAMAFSGSSAFYMQQRGITGSGSRTHSGLQGSPGFHLQPNPNLHYQSTLGTATVTSTLPVESSPGVSSSHGGNLGAASTLVPGEAVRRKRGRPRKYGPDGAVALALNPSTASRLGAISSAQKRGRGRPPGSGRKQQFASLGEWLSSSAGVGFTPHVITIAIGEDIAAKVMAFAQQGPRSVCILSANGAVSTVTLHQPSSSGGFVTYEGRFEILCLSGSYLLTGDSCDRTGGLTVSLASPDGRVIGGGVGGVLIAASHVQVIAGTFSWGGSKSKNKKGDVQLVDDSVHQSGDAHATGTFQSPNLVSASLVGVWPASQPLDVHSTHVDIDLMRG